GGVLEGLLPDSGGTGLKFQVTTAATAAARIATVAILNQRESAFGGTGCGEKDPLAIASSSAKGASAISCKRCLGSFWRQRRRRNTAGGARSVGSSPQSGSLFRTEAKTSVMVSPSNACLPVIASNITHPNAQMSLRLSGCRPRACS